MEVILLQRVEKLGQMGDVVAVKAGYARNYLIPNNKALRATNENKSFFETQKAQIELNNLNLKKEAEAVFTKVDSLIMVLIRSSGEGGHLYGSVRPQDIAVALAEKGFTISKSNIIIGNAIKVLGISEVILNLHAEVKATILVNVARSEDEAKVQMDRYVKSLNKANIPQEHLTKNQQKKASIKEAELEIIAEESTIVVD